MPAKSPATSIPSSGKGEKQANEVEAPCRINISGYMATLTAFASSGDDVTAWAIVGLNE